jgi:hypothetical protein
MGTFASMKETGGVHNKDLLSSITFPVFAAGNQDYQGSQRIELARSE